MRTLILRASSLLLLPLLGCGPAPAPRSSAAETPRGPSSGGGAASNAPAAPAAPSVELPAAVQVSAGAWHTCAAFADGTARCWGANSAGQLGLGRAGDAPSPEPFAVQGRVTEVAAGGAHSCARTEDGRVWCAGALATAEGAPEGRPVAVEGVSGVAHLAAGEGHVCALTGEGAVWCWGLDDEGQAGPAGAPAAAAAATAAAPAPRAGRHGGRHGRRHRGTEEAAAPAPAPAAATAVRVTPRRIEGVTARALALGARHSCARGTDGTVRCWGRNRERQLGDAASTEGHSAPFAVPGLTGVDQLVAGSLHTCAHRASGWSCWGRNAPLGEAPASAATPAALEGAEAGSRVVLGGVERARGFHCVGAAAGGLRCQESSELAGSEPWWDALPASVAPRAVSLGGAHGCAIDAAGALWCFGANRRGQLGVGAAPFHAGVQWVQGLPPVRALAAGDDQSCAVSTSGELWCWGQNAFEVLYEDPGTRGRREASEAHRTLAGPPFVAGEETQPTARRVEGVSRVVRASLRRAWGCVATQDNTVLCWGGVMRGESGGAGYGVSAGLRGVDGVLEVRGLAMGPHLGCAAQVDGRTVCWGLNGDGRAGRSHGPSAFRQWQAPGVAELASLDADEEGFCGATRDGRGLCWSTEPTEGVRIVRATEAGATQDALEGLRLVVGEQGHRCGLTAQGQVLCWGATERLVAASSGCEGVYSAEVATSRAGLSTGNAAGAGGASAMVDVQVTGLRRVTLGLTPRTLSTGVEHLCGFGEEGVVRCAGRMATPPARLDGDVPEDRFDARATEPRCARAVEGLAGAGVLASGSNHACALTADGRVGCWGDNSHGQLGNGWRAWEGAARQVARVRGG